MRTADRVRAPDREQVVMLSPSFGWVRVVWNRTPAQALLTYPAQRCGATLVVVERWDPTGKTVSACGHLLASLGLRTSRWMRRWTGQSTCLGCGTRRDQDSTAVKNITAAAGLAPDTAGRDVNRQGFALALLPVKQAPVGASPPGIPVQQVRE